MASNFAFGTWYRLPAMLEGADVDYVVVGTPDEHRIVAMFEHATWTPEVARAYAKLIAGAPTAIATLRLAERLIDELVLGPLDLAAKYGPNHTPFTPELMVYVRTSIQNAIHAVEP